MSLGTPTICRDRMGSALPRRGPTQRFRLPAVVRPDTNFLQDFGPCLSSIAAVSMHREWTMGPPRTGMARPEGGRVYALILGRHSGIYPRRFRHLKNVPLITDDVGDVRDLRPYLLRYLPEGVYYNRNVYAPLPETRAAGINYSHARRSRFLHGQELAFDLDPENLDCPIHGDIEAKIRRHQGLSFCDWEFEETRRQATALFDEAAFRLTRAERSRIAKSFARRYPIDEWVTSGEMRLIRLPYSLHGMVSRIVTPVPRRKLERFHYYDPSAVLRL